MNPSASEATIDSERDPLSQEEHSSSRSGRRLRQLLEGSSLALFLIFLARLLPLFIGFRPLSPAWQNQFLTMLVSDGLFAFLGFVFIHFAVFVQPRNNPLKRRLRMVRHLAVIPVVGYLLLIPLQLTNSFGDLSRARSEKMQYLERSTHLSEVREAVQNASSANDMNVRLQSLSEPALTADQLKMRLPELRRTLLNANTVNQEEVTRLLNQIGRSFDPISVIVKRGGTALGWALAFASGAVPWGHHSTLLELMRRRKTRNAQGR
jgi:hypothetical protein